MKPSDVLLEFEIAYLASLAKDWPGDQQSSIHKLNSILASNANLYAGDLKTLFETSLKEMKKASKDKLPPYSRIQYKTGIALLTTGLIFIYFYKNLL